MYWLCKLFGHKLSTSSFACSDGSHVFVSKCERCNYTATRIVSYYLGQQAKQQTYMFQRRGE